MSYAACSGTALYGHCLRMCLLSSANVESGFDGQLSTTGNAIQILFETRQASVIDCMQNLTELFEGTHGTLATMETSGGGGGARGGGGQKQSSADVRPSTRA